MNTLKQNTIMPIYSVSRLIFFKYSSDIDNVLLKNIQWYIVLPSDEIMVQTRFLSWCFLSFVVSLDISNTCLHSLLYGFTETVLFQFSCFMDKEKSFITSFQPCLPLLRLFLYAFVIYTLICAIFFSTIIDC